MAEKHVYFQCNEIRLEGLLHIAPGERGAVISHPHPLYGGNMHNPVVETIARTYQRMGYSTLRYNFRGVGNSRGRHDQGRGERDDVGAALHYLAEQGKDAIDLVGYSFGAWVNALANPGEDLVQRVVMVSPPVAFVDFQEVPPIAQLKLVIAATLDSFGPPAQIETLLPSWNPQARLEIIPGADHFYVQYTDELQAVLSSFLRETEAA